MLEVRTQTIFLTGPAGCPVTFTFDDTVVNFVVGLTGGYLPYQQNAASLSTVRVHLPAMASGNTITVLPCYSMTSLDLTANPFLVVTVLAWTKDFDNGISLRNIGTVNGNNATLQAYNSTSVLQTVLAGFDAFGPSNQLTEPPLALPVSTASIVTSMSDLTVQATCSSVYNQYGGWASADVGVIYADTSAISSIYAYPFSVTQSENGIDCSQTLSYTTLGVPSGNTISNLALFLTGFRTGGDFVFSGLSFGVGAPPTFDPYSQTVYVPAALGLTGDNSVLYQTSSFVLIAW